MIIFYLLLGHLIADFLLQPNCLIKLKIRRWYGILLHVLIHLVVLFILLLPYCLGQTYLISPGISIAKYFSSDILNFSPTLNIILAILFITISHFIVDYFKILYEKKHHKYVLSYWIDQLSHYTIIVAASLLTLNIKMIVPRESLGQWLLGIYLNPYWAIYMVGALFVTFTLEIGLFEVAREHNPDAVLHFNKKAMLRRLAIFSLPFALFSVASFIS